MPLSWRHCFKQPLKSQRYFYTILMKVLMKLQRHLKWTCLSDLGMVLTNVSTWRIMVLRFLDIADRHTDMLNDFVGMTKDLKSECLHQISVDGSTVNIKFFQEFSRMRIIIHLSNQCWKIWMDLEETYVRSICDFLQHLIKKRRLQKRHMSFNLSSPFLPSYTSKLYYCMFYWFSFLGIFWF